MSTYFPGQRTLRATIMGSGSLLGTVLVVASFAGPAVAKRRSRHGVKKFKGMGLVPW